MFIVNPVKLFHLLCLVLLMYVVSPTIVQFVIWMISMSLGFLFGFCYTVLNNQRHVIPQQVNNPPKRESAQNSEHATSK